MDVGIRHTTTAVKHHEEPGLEEKHEENRAVIHVDYLVGCGVASPATVRSSASQLQHRQIDTRYPAAEMFGETFPSLRTLVLQRHHLSSSNLIPYIAISLRVLVL